MPTQGESRRNISCKISCGIFAARGDCSCFAVGFLYFIRRESKRLRIKQIINFLTTDISKVIPKVSACPQSISFHGIVAKDEDKGPRSTEATPLAKGRRTVQLEVTVDVSRSSHAEFKVLDNHCQFAKETRRAIRYPSRRSGLSRTWC